MIYRRQIKKERKKRQAASLLKHLQLGRLCTTNYFSFEDIIHFKDPMPLLIFELKS
jgi:hypothetical protein